MRFVLDTAAMVAAIRSDGGASRRLLQAALEGRGITLLISVPLLIEYEAVLTRPEHLKASRLSDADIAALLDGVAAVAEHVNFDFVWRPSLTDADDEMVLETAVNGHAEAIVTFNTRDFSPAAARFGIPAIRPAQAVSLWEKSREKK